MLRHDPVMTERPATKSPAGRSAGPPAPSPPGSAIGKKRAAASISKVTEKRARQGPRTASATPHRATNQTIYAATTSLTPSLRVPDVPLHTLYFLREPHHRPRAVDRATRPRVLAHGNRERRRRLHAGHRHSVAADL